MRKLLCNSIVALCFVLPVHVSAQTLWGGTEFGMSVDQVKAVVPDAVAPSRPSRLASGAQEEFRLSPLEIVNKKFTAKFFFLANKLTQVSLAFDPGRPYTFHEATSVFDALTDALRAKYGQEIRREVKRHPLNTATATWVVGRTNITVFAISVSEENAALNVSYQVRLAREADKL